MRLIELEPYFITYNTKIEMVRRVVNYALWNANGRGDIGLEIKPGPVYYRSRVETLAEAQGIVFLCPLCFTKNNGTKGTHSCEVTFSGKGVKDDEGVHNDLGIPVRWSVTGNNFEDLSTSPSVLLLSGCRWHGFITAGNVSILGG